MKLTLKEYKDQLAAIKGLPVESRKAMLKNLQTASVVEVDGEGKETPVKVELMELDAPPVDPKTIEDIEAKAKEDAEAAILKDTDTISKLVKEALAEERKANPGQKKLPATQKKDEKYTIPAEVKRVGQLQYFKNTTVNGLAPDERAFRFGMWALAARGNDTAKTYCREYGIGVVEAKFADDIMQKLQQENVNTAGGYLVPEEFGTDLIDLKEKYGVARRIFSKETMISDTKTIPRRTGGLTAYFVAEGAAGTESTTAWDQVRLVAKDLMVLTRMTNQLNADSVISWADRLAYECSYANTLKEDQCAFAGDGTSTYGGIRGVTSSLTGKWTASVAGTATGITKASSTTIASLTLADFQNAVGSLPQFADTPNAVWVAHRSFYFGTMQRLELAAGGNTINEIANGDRRARPLFLGYPVEFAQVLPSTTAATTIFALLGDFTLGATFGDRMQDSIAFSSEASIGSQSMWERNEMGVRCIERMDVNVHDVGDGTTPGPIVGVATG